MGIGTGIVFNPGVAGGGQITIPVPISQGGTGQPDQTSAFDALSPATTNGDIIVYNGTDNVRADNPAHPVIQTGRYLMTPNFATLGSINVSATIAYASPVYIVSRSTWTGVGFSVNGSATILNVKVGLYNNSSGAPSTLVTGSTATGGPYTDIADTSHAVSFSSPITINPGWYWIAIIPDQTQSVKATNSAMPGSFVGCPDALQLGGRFSVSGQTYAGGLPSPFGTPTITVGAGAIYLGLVAQ